MPRRRGPAAPVVEARVEHERADVQRLGGRRGSHQRREGGGGAEVVGHVQHVVAHVLGPAGPILNRRLALGGVQTEPEPKFSRHRPSLELDSTPHVWPRIEPGTRDLELGELVRPSKGVTP